MQPGCSKQRHSRKFGQCIQLLLHAFHVGQLDMLALSRGRCRRLGLAQSQTCQEGLKFQTSQQIIQRIAVHLHIGQRLHIDRQRCIPLDRCQPIAVPRSLLTVRQFVPQTLFDFRCIQMAIHFVQAAKSVQQIHCRLFSDTRYTRNIIRAVAHQRLEIDQANGIKTVLFSERLRCDVSTGILSTLRRYQMHRRMCTHQLQAVAVTGHDQAIITLLFCLAADRADQVIGLISALLTADNAQRVQHFFHHRQLCCELVRHALSGRLVGVKLLMAEGFLLHVKAYDRAIGGIFIL